MMNFAHANKTTETQLAMRNIRSADPFFSEDDQKHILSEVPKILDGILSMGPNVAAFEKEFAETVGAKHAIAMNSCTSALEISLAFLDLKPDEEVIVPAQTFIATAMAVHLSGARPIFAEIEEASFCLDPDDVAKKITRRTRAVIIVHFAGFVTPRINELKKICANANIALIEDAAHTPGGKQNGRWAGTIGDAGCFSFFPTKIITCGDGGMLVTDRDELAEFARSMQHRGRDFSAEKEMYINAGRNVRMPELSALLGRVQLSHLNENLTIRQRNAQTYKQALHNYPGVICLQCEDSSQAAWLKFPIILEPEINRDAVLKQLHKRGVFADVSYDPPLHLQPFFVNEYGLGPGHLPRTENILSRHICFPNHPRLSEDDIQYVIDNIITVLQAQ